MHRPSSETSFDEFFERVVREVLRRLATMNVSTSAVGGTGGAAVQTVDRRLITAETLESLPPGTVEVRVPAAAVITPLARDEAKERGIRLVRQTTTETKR